MSIHGLTYAFDLVEARRTSCLIIQSEAMKLWTGLDFRKQGLDM